MDPVYLSAILMSASAVFFATLSQCLKYAVPTRSTSSVYDKFRFVNFAISGCHAAIAGVWAVYCFVAHGTEMWENRIYFTNAATYGLACFSSGYFIYDVGVIVVAGHARLKWDVICHHAALLSCCLYCVTTGKCISYVVLAMMAEVNTVFLHLRKVLRMSGLAIRHPAVQFSKFANYVTYIPVRGAVLFFQAYWCLYDDHKYLPYPLLVQFWIAEIALTVINVILLYRIVLADQREAEMEKQKTL